MSRAQLVIAFIVLGAWIGSLIVRVFRQVGNEFVVVDSSVLLVLGFMFSANAIRKRNGNTPIAKGGSP